MLAAAFILLVAPSAARAQTSIDAMYPPPSLANDVLLAAERITPLDFGNGLALQGGEARDSTLRIRVTIPPELEDSVDRLHPSLLGASCQDDETMRLLWRGAGFEFAYLAADESEIEVISVDPRLCGAFATSGVPEEDVRIAAMIDGIGLEAALTRIAGEERSKLIADNIAIERVEPEGTRLRFDIAAGAAMDLEEAATTLDTILCSDPPMRTLLKAGATFEYRIADAAAAANAVLTDGDCP